MIEKYHLPILDSRGCTVVLDCNYQSSSYGQVFLRTPTVYYDENLQENIYLKFDFAAKIIRKLLTI